MDLGTKQKIFSQLIASLIHWIKSQGYEVTLGEAWRSPETAELYAKEKKGIKHSIHCLRLAVDLLLFKDGKYLTDSKDYEFAGVYWEELSTEEYECAWGGRFNSLPDGNHFSIAHGGVR